MTPTATIKNSIRLEGKGIHTGEMCGLTLHPQGAGTGILFTRKGAEKTPALIEFAAPEQSDRRTVLIGKDGERYEQVEHLLAALYAIGVSDLLIEFQGPEVPFFLGGAYEYFEALEGTGLEETGGEWPELKIDSPHSATFHDARLLASPDAGLRLTAFVEFPGTIVGSMGHTHQFSPDHFREEIARARTFAHKKDLDRLWQAGLARGGSLENAVVFGEEGYENEELNYPDEVARHKIIDLLGDLSLMGTRLQGHFWAWKAGHRSHLDFARSLSKESAV